MSLISACCVEGSVLSSLRERNFVERVLVVLEVTASDRKLAGEGL